MITRPIRPRVLIIAPRVGLITQTLEAFKEYSQNDPSMHVGSACSDDSNNLNASILCVTWQSIYKKNESWFEQFDCIIGDEVHHFKAKSLSYIMASSINAPYRWGLTGTLDDSEINTLSIEGHFGPVYQVTKTKKLIDNGTLSKLEPIEIMHLSYSDSDRKFLNDLKRQNSGKTKGSVRFNKEVEFLCNHHERNRLIIDTTLSLKGNTLVLFSRVEEHGKPLLRDFIAEASTKTPTKRIMYVSGETPKDERETIRKTVNASSESILIASEGTFSTGIDIPNIHNIVLCMPGKSKIKLLQSIGRGLRKASNGQSTRIIDFVDDLSFQVRLNFSLQHAAKRIQIYQAEGFSIATKSIKIP